VSESGDKASQGPLVQDAGSLGPKERAELERLRAENEKLRSHPTPSEPGFRRAGRYPAPPARLAWPGRGSC